MIHVFEHSEFPVGPLGVDRGLEGPGQLLDGHFHGAAIGQKVLGVRSAANLKTRRQIEELRDQLC